MSSPEPASPRTPSTVVSALKVILGLALSVWGGYALTQGGWRGAAVCFFFGLLIGIGVRLALTGALAVTGRLLPLRPSYGIIALFIVLSILVGPGISASYHRGKEARMWAAIKDSRKQSDSSDYLYNIPEPFQRKEFDAHWQWTSALEAAESHHAERLRSILKTINTEHANDPAYAPAREEASRALEALFADAMKKLSASKGTDPALQAAFKQIVQKLSTQADGTIYVLFSNHSVMTPPSNSEQRLAAIRQDAHVLKYFPRGDAPVVEVGDAFAPSYDQKRRDTFLKATDEAFGEVFSPDLLQVRALPAGETPKGKIVFSVISTAHRSPTYFERTRGDEHRTVGILYGYLVLWNFEIFDENGKPMYVKQHVSRPASETHMLLSPSDPEWAPYSIMMDSAYYNYCRQIVAGFGLKPPAVKDSFEFK